MRISGRAAGLLKAISNTPNSMSRTEKSYALISILRSMFMNITKTAVMLFAF